MVLRSRARISSRERFCMSVSRIRQFCETELESMQEFDVCAQKIMDKRDIDLRHYAVGPENWTT